MRAFSKCLAYIGIVVGLWIGVGLTSGTVFKMERPKEAQQDLKLYQRADELIKFADVEQERTKKLELLQIAYDKLQEITICCPSSTLPVEELLKIIEEKKKSIENQQR